MQSESQKIRSFTDLRAWQERHKLTLMLYKVTKQFPKEEQFGLTNQLRRAGISFTSNIAEGFSRGSYREKSQFYSMALGSLTEIQNQLLVARDVGYISRGEFDKIARQTVVVSKITNGLIKASRVVIRNS